MTTFDETAVRRDLAGKFVEQGRTAPDTGTLADLVGVTTTQDHDYLEDRRGIFTDGYTSEDIDRFAGNIESVEIVCLWDYHDEYGTGGGSQIYGRPRNGGPYRELSEAAHAYLFDGEGDTPDFLLAGEPTTDFTPEELDEFDGVGMANFAREWSGDSDDEDVAGECPDCGAGLTHDQVSDGHCPDCADRAQARIDYGLSNNEVFVDDVRNTLAGKYGPEAADRAMDRFALHRDAVGDFDSRPAMSGLYVPYLDQNAAAWVKTLDQVGNVTVPDGDRSAFEHAVFTANSAPNYLATHPGHTIVRKPDGRYVAYTSNSWTQPSEQPLLPWRPPTGEMVATVDPDGLVEPVFEP